MWAALDYWSVIMIDGNVGFVGSSDGMHSDGARKDRSRE